MPGTVKSRLQGSQPLGNILSTCGGQRRSVRYRGCWTPPPAARRTPPPAFAEGSVKGGRISTGRRPCARTILGIFEPECRVPGLRQSAAALLRQIAWAGLSGRVTAEALPRCFGGVRRAGSEHLTVQEPAYATLNVADWQGRPAPLRPQGFRAGVGAEEGGGRLQNLAPRRAQWLSGGGRLRRWPSRRTRRSRSCAYRRGASWGSRGGSPSSASPGDPRSVATGSIRIT